MVFAGDYAVDGTYAVETTYAVVCTCAVTGVYAVDGDYAVGCDYSVNGTYAVYAVACDYAVYAVTLAGGTVVSDLFGQIGVLVVQSANAAFAELMGAYAVVEEVGSDFGWQGIPQGRSPHQPDPSSAASEVPVGRWAPPERRRAATR